ncbi:MAG: hypothetical protein N2254_02350 [bacterium]|nr:hypothetical protein [bacterium]
MGEDPKNFRICALVFVYIDEDRERALYDFQKPCMWYFRNLVKLIPATKYPGTESFYANLHNFMLEYLKAYDQGVLTFKSVVEDGPFSHGFLVGDPDYVVRKMYDLIKSYKLTDILCWTRLGGLDHRKVKNSMELLCKKVIPRLKQRV